MIAIQLYERSVFNQGTKNQVKAEYSKPLVSMITPVYSTNPWVCTTSSSQEAEE